MCMKILNFIIMGQVPSTLHGKRYISAKAVASLKVVLIIVIIALSVKGKKMQNRDPWQNYTCIILLCLAFEASVYYYNIIAAR